MDSNRDKQINLGGRTDVDILVLLGREREGQISDWKNGEQGRVTMTVKYELGIRVWGGGVNDKIKVHG